jgi:hypothetical protein
MTPVCAAREGESRYAAIWVDSDEEEVENDVVENDVETVEEDAVETVAGTVEEDAVEEDAVEEDTNPFQTPRKKRRLAEMVASSYVDSPFRDAPLSPVIPLPSAPPRRYATRSLATPLGVRPYCRVAACELASLFPTTPSVQVRPYSRFQPMCRPTPATYTIPTATHTTPLLTLHDLQTPPRSAGSLHLYDLECASQDTSLYSCHEDRPMSSPLLLSV